MLRRLAICLAILGAACAPLGGTLRPDGFHHNSLPIHLQSRDDRPNSFVSPDWQLDNFKMGPNGWEQKTGPGYSTQVPYDLSGDTSDGSNRSFVEAPAFDVLLKHRGSGDGSCRDPDGFAALRCGR
jgi:hypothetical protein